MWFGFPSNFQVLKDISFDSQDDIIDDVESFVAAAEILKERGAYKIFVMATHGLLSADAPRLIEESSIDEAGIHRWQIEPFVCKKECVLFVLKYQYQIMGCKLTGKLCVKCKPVAGINNGGINDINT